VHRLIAAPGTPKALVTPSFSITSTAAIAAFIFAIASLLEGGFEADSLPGWSTTVRTRTAPAGDLRYSAPESPGRARRWSNAGLMERVQALRLFVRVVDLGLFSKAAAECGIGQAAATKQVAQLERHLGARLLHRSTHGVSPTEVPADRARRADRQRGPGRRPLVAHRRGRPYVTRRQRRQLSMSAPARPSRRARGAPPCGPAPGAGVRR
jgi:hypothetical protein